MSGGASLTHAVLLILALLNAALVVRFYRHCFKESISYGKERLVQSFSFMPGIRSPGRTARESKEDDPLAWIEKDEEAEFILGQSFTSALGLPPDGNIHVQRESERLQLRGARLLQKYIYDRQIKACERGERVKIYQLTEEHRFGLFSQVLGAAHSLLDALAHGYVFSWNATRILYVDQRRCPSRGYECFFLPITSCTGDDALVLKENVRNSCAFEMPKRRTHEQAFMVNVSEWRDMLPVLRNITGISSLGRPDLFNVQFFAREALRFISRPNSDLIALTQDILHGDLPSPPNWRPFGPLIRIVSAHLRAGADKKGQTGVLGPDYYIRTIQSIATLGLEQVVFSSDDRATHLGFEAKVPDVTVDNCETSRNKVRALSIPQERFGQTKSINSEDLIPVDDNSAKKVETAAVKYDVGMLLLAQAFVFSRADAFVGLYSSNVGVSIALFMSALRHTSAIPIFDAGGSPLPACHQFTEYPLRFIRHPDMSAD